MTALITDTFDLAAELVRVPTAPRRAPRPAPARTTRPGARRPSTRPSRPGHLTSGGLSAAVGARACAVEVPVVRATPMIERVSLTERGLAVVVSSVAVLALLSALVVLSTFFSFSNAPLG